jgi:hypothetical protein
VLAVSLLGLPGCGGSSGSAGGTSAATASPSDWRHQEVAICKKFKPGLDRHKAAFAQAEAAGNYQEAADALDRANALNRQFSLQARSVPGLPASKAKVADIYFAMVDRGAFASARAADAYRAESLRSATGWAKRGYRISKYLASLNERLGLPTCS